jgi:uncharacterized membrane protein YeaQ/YmgE (transglycosylase-associated protein family)
MWAQVLLAVAVGAIAGWLRGTISGRYFGRKSDLAAGIIGAFLGTYLLADWEVPVVGETLTTAVHAAVGALIALLISGLSYWISAHNTNFRKELREWLQAIAIFLFGFAAIYQFWYKEVSTPQKSPVNVTTGVAINEAGSRDISASGKSLEAIEVTVSATNPSSRNVYLLRNCWTAHAHQVQIHNDSEDWFFLANTELESPRKKNSIMTHYEVMSDVLVGAGYVFEQEILRPGESISRSFVFYLPRGAYDLLDVDVGLPTTPIQGSATAFWRFDHKDNNLKPKITIKDARDNTISQEEAEYNPGIQLQYALTTRQISLWRGEALGVVKSSGQQ